MRVVLDTNVVVSGVLSPHGPPGRILDLVLAGDLTLLHDDRILAEYREVLLRPKFGFRAADVAALLDTFLHEAVSIRARLLDHPLPDPDDLPFLEIAVAGSADALVTGNLRHFPDDAVPSGLDVVSPRAFLDHLR